MSTPGASFDAGWLALREPFDAAARDEAHTLVSRLRTLRREAGPWRVMDLGCGTGANLRWLAPRLGGAQQWLALDHDAALLRAWERQPGFRQHGAGALRWRGPGFEVEALRQRADLARELASLPWQAAQLVTASALLDLAGTAWLERVAALATGARACLLFALNVNGRHDWTPRDPDDARVEALFAAHQRRDKGLGPALGAEAVPWLARALRERGYRVQTARSDWRLDPGSTVGDAIALQRALIDGMAGAATEQAARQGVRVRAWRERRQRAVPLSTLRVGHVDLLAWPAR